MHKEKDVQDKGIKISSLMKLYSLILLNEKQMHGYLFIKEVEEKLGKKISAGEIYPFLAKLTKQGYIKVIETDNRKKKVYSLTPKGKKFVKKLLEQFSNIIDIAIKPSLHKCAHCGCDIYKKGFEKTVHGRKLIFCCKYCAKAFR